jgi:lysozyme
MLNSLFAMVARLFQRSSGALDGTNGNGYQPVNTGAIPAPPVSPSNTSSAALAPTPSTAAWLDLCQPLTEASEGCVLTAYPDPASGADPWTVGYGATGPDVTRGTVWTQGQADSRLAADLMRFASGVDSAVTVSLTGAQKAALVDFAFNVGLGNLRSSTLLSLLNAGNHAGAADQFAVWNKADGKVMPGLVTRRARERSLFLTGAWQ